MTSDKPSLVDARAFGSAIGEVLRNEGLTPSSKQISKIIQLHQTLQVRHGCMVVGPTLSGKSVIIKTLAKAMSLLGSQGNPNYTRVHTHYLNPKSITMGQLYGEVNPLTKDWKNGVVTHLVLNATQDQSLEKHWVVFDGPVDALWIENMNTVLDDNKMLCLANGLRIKLSPQMSMVFEVADLAVASPATVSRCGMVYVDPSDLSWRTFMDSWLKSAEFLGEEFTDKEVITGQISDLMEKFFDKIFNFLAQKGEYYIKPTDLNLVISFTKIFASLFRSDNGISIEFKLPPTEEEITEEDEQKFRDDHYQYLTNIINLVFGFSVTWSFGAVLSEKTRPEFDLFISDLLGSIFPVNGCVFDYRVCFETNELVPWENSVEEYQYNPNLPYFSALVPTIDTVRYSYLLSKLQSTFNPVLFTGGSGVGKTVIISDSLDKITNSSAVSTISLTFSAQTSANRTQDMLEMKLEQKRKGILGPAGLSKSVCLFIDDLNMPKKEVYGAQPPIELLRQILDYSGFYDRSKGNWLSIQSMSMIAACAPPGGGRSDVTPRVIRHFNQFVIPQPSEAVLGRIFGCLLSGYLEAKNFKKEIIDMSRNTVHASIDIYNLVLSQMRPTPSKSHYTFNLRDLSKVIQGVTMIEPSHCTDGDSFVRLWSHESMRVFHDRLVEEGDREWFKKTLFDLAKKHLSVLWDYDELFASEVPLVFSDLTAHAGLDIKPYQQVKDWEKLIKVLRDSLEDYNVSNSNEMDLVFFEDAIKHICRISRILRQPRGNALLVGVGGSGKQSLTRLAAHVAEFDLFRIELTRNYGISNFREDLRSMYNKAGIEGKSVVFLLTDSQIVDDSFLEDVNNILNSGEVPNLYENEDYEELITQMRPIIRELGLSETRDAIYHQFIQRVRDNLHVVLCMSPVGDSFRRNCRQFPSLINCCTIDWFEPWPATALLSVAKHFLGKVDLNGDVTKSQNDDATSRDVVDDVARVCVEIHESVVQSSELFFQRLRRRYYVTPTSYLELLQSYSRLLAEKREEIGQTRDKLLNGLQKLAETNSKTDEMKVELTEMEPILKDSAAKTASLLEKLEVDQAEAAKIKNVVQEEESVVTQQAEEANAIADDAQRDLDEALPQLEQAIKALDALKTSDIYEIKAFIKPPQLVQTVMEAVCILMGSKPDWAAAKSLLGDTQLIPKLRNYKNEMDQGKIPNSTFNKLSSYIENPDFVPEVVKNVSVAAMSLCMWARSIDVYHKVSKTVEPKKARLREAQANLAKNQAKLKEKQAELKKVEDQLAELQSNYENQMASKKRLELKISDTNARLERATQLTVLLADEQVRWERSASQLTEQLNTLIGTMVVAAGSLSYLGAFTTEYRQEMIMQWIKLCEDRHIPISSDFSLINTLSSPVKVREWNIQGLPTDDVSVENAVISSRSQRWPLFIDPQGQAVDWIKNMEGSHGLKVVKMTSVTNTTLIRTLEQAVYIGTPVLLEDIGEEIDPALEPILKKKIFKVQGQDMIRIGDSDVQYDSNFRLYITTKLPNPHYLPEVCISVTILNFTVTRLGLENQLLGDVVKSEKPSLEADRDHLILSMASDRKQLKDFEDQILHLINTTDNVLDDDGLINTLNQSKVTSSVISQRVGESEVTEAKINKARESFRPMATRGSILYFVITDLALIDSMYQFSLSYFSNLFQNVLKNAQQSENLEERLKFLIDGVTELTFENVCRGIFEKDKLVFAFLIASSIERNSKLISEEDWNFFLKGPTTLDLDLPDNRPSWIGDREWELINYMGQLTSFDGIVDDVINQSDTWQEWSQQESLDYELPSPWNEKSSNFQFLMFVQIFKQKQTIFALSQYVSKSLGQKYTSALPFDLPTVFNDSSPSTPIVFILSVGADPTETLLKFAEERGYSDRLHTRSLGQNQGPIAEMYIQDARKSGDWVYLSNCHLAESWMPCLERIVLSLSTGQVHPDFRLWLSSMPSKNFPVTVLQNSIKLTNEPPKGLKANLIRTLNQFNEQDFNSHPKLLPFRRLSFGLAFFHALIQQRKSWGPTAFNIPYAISDSDFAISLSTLNMFLAEQDEIPWEALRYLTGDIAYGGRFTDGQDKRALSTILNKFYTPEILEKGYLFYDLPTYYSPEAESIEELKEYAFGLPEVDSPEIFGLHPNASISLYISEAKQLLSTVIGLQPRSGASGGGQTAEELVSQLALKLLKSLPEEINLDEAEPSLFAKGPDGIISALSNTLNHEVIKYNSVVRVVKSSLEDLGKAIEGLVVMSYELELVFTSLLNNQVPSMWANAAYPSTKPLNSWFTDFNNRVEFFRDWVRNGKPKVFNMATFSFPQGFLTSVLQLHARKYKIPIDTLSFRFEFLSDSSQIDLSKDGVFVDGLYMESGAWVWEEDKSFGYVDEPVEGVLYSKMPLVHFIPVENYKGDDFAYLAPLYKTIERRGVLSTTGHSTNYVLSIEIPTKKDKSHWISRGCALILL
ncbi:hypothetical protein P9112_008343 [Eukaryota sp. TZLM1-RC]